MAQSIYENLLKKDFFKLSPVLQQIHGGGTNIKAKGIVQVEYGDGFMIKLINKILKMPNQDKHIITELQINRSLEKEVWERDFNGRILRTEQYVKNDYLIEQMGNIILGFKLYVKNQGLEFEQDFTSIYNIRLPKLLSVSTTAFTIAQNNIWYVDVKTTSPIFGLLLRYHGSFKLE